MITVKLYKLITLHILKFQISTMLLKKKTSNSHNISVPQFYCPFELFSWKQGIFHYQGAPHIFQNRGKSIRNLKRIDKAPIFEVFWQIEVSRSVA